MSRTTRSARFVLAAVGFLAVSRVASTRAQEGAPDPAGLVPSLRADAALARQLDAARDHLAAQSWAEGTHILRSLLDSPEDALVSVKRRGPDGGEVVCWTGLRAEAARLLGTMPPAGRALYEARYGPRARALLVEARRDADPHGLTEIVRRYPHTAAGVEALRLLGAYRLDRGCPTLAALCFGRLLDGPGGDAASPATLFDAALAFRRAGDAARAEQVWRRLTAAAPGGVRLGGTAIGLADLKKELDRAARRGTEPPMNVAGGEPSLEPLWAVRTAEESGIRPGSWLNQAVQLQEARDLAVLPGSCPVVAGGRVVYRSYRGLHAVDVLTGCEVWEAPSPWSMERLAAHAQHRTHLMTWVNAYLDVSPHVLFDNAVLGTLTTDGARVYAVDDLGVPPYRNYPRFGGRWHQEVLGPDYGPELTEAVRHSRLLALDAASGETVWELGRGDPEAGESGDGYFLGPPLPLDGHLYVVTEKANEVSLACLRTADGGLVWKQPLAASPTRLLLDPGRRVQAARPTYAGGVLVCPTNAGVVLGIDLLTRDLAWAYPYPTEALTQSPPSWERRGRPGPPRVVAEWRAPVVCVRQDRVVFAAPDEASVHCLSLHDGRPLWRAERHVDDLYVADVVAGKVLVVGKQVCRALDLADGRHAWQLDTGVPSGRGVAGGGIYYLPLKEGTREKAPAVYAIDIERGVIAARTPLPGKDVPGNLLLWQGAVLSQTPTGVTAYGER